MANVRKLMRMAREYEADEGRDLRGFIDAVAERDVIQAREGEAPLEAEALDAVRMMTVHRAKGLEFPVVCLADLGKDGRDDDGQLRISEDGSVGLRLANLGGGAVDSARLGRHQGRGQARRRGGGAPHLLRGGHARAGAPGPQRRHRPRQAPGPCGAPASRCAGSGAASARGCRPRATHGHRRGRPRGPRGGSALDALHARERSTRCCPAADRARVRRRQRPSPPTSSRCSSSACRRRRGRWR